MSNLALYRINDGTCYQGHLDTASRPQGTLKLVAWVRHAQDAAKGWCVEFEPDREYQEIFDDDAILKCAAQLAEYYDQHATEIEIDRENQAVAKLARHALQYDAERVRKFHGERIAHRGTVNTAW